MIKILLSIILICIFTTPHSLIATDKVVNIYSARKEALIPVSYTHLTLPTNREV